MSDAGPSARLGLGGRLHDARETLGLAEEDVADALNLPLRVIVDLEAEVWDRLPAAAFTRGYIRAYAKLLELDSDELVADYETDVGPAQTVELELPAAIAARSSGGIADLMKAPPNAMVGRLLIGVLGVALVAWLIWPEGEGQPAVVKLDPAEAPTEAPVVLASEPRLDPAAAQVAAPPEADAPAALSDAESTDADPVELSTRTDVLAAAQTTPVEQPPEVVELGTEPRREQDEIAAPSSEREAPVEPEPTVNRALLADAPAGAVKTRRITDVGDDRLQLRFTDDCWVEVKGAGNRNLYGDLGRSGETLELVGEAPFRLLLGYAPGVALAYNGEPVVLADFTRNNVAALWLGRR